MLNASRWYFSTKTSITSDHRIHEGLCLFLVTDKRWSQEVLKTLSNYDFTYNWVVNRFKLQVHLVHVAWNHDIFLLDLTLFEHYRTREKFIVLLYYQIDHGLCFCYSIMYSTLGDFFLALLLPHHDVSLSASLEFQNKHHIKHLIFVNWAVILNA